MVKVGGINLPKTISSAMGHDLAVKYIESGVTSWQEGLTRVFASIGGTLTISEENGKFTAKTTYPCAFCPLGGDPDPSKNRFDVTAEAICRPYVLGFVDTFGSKIEGHIEVQECILRDGGSCCDMEFTFNE